MYKSVFIYSWYMYKWCYNGYAFMFTIGCCMHTVLQAGHILLMCVYMNNMYLHMYLCHCGLGMTLNYIQQWRAWTGLEDRVRLPQTTVTCGWPLAKAKNPLSPPPGNGKISGSRLVDAGINQQTGSMAEITLHLVEMWCNWKNSRGQ